MVIRKMHLRLLVLNQKYNFETHREHFLCLLPSNIFEYRRENFSKGPPLALIQETGTSDV